MPSVMDQIRKLDEQKAQLLETAKKEALEQAQSAIAALNELGFSYRLVEGEGQTQSRRAPSSEGGTGRRSGIRDRVLSLIKEKKDGATRAELLEAVGVKGDKSGEQSVSNALSAMKRANTIKQEGNRYKAA